MLPEPSFEASATPGAATGRRFLSMQPSGHLGPLSNIRAGQASIMLPNILEEGSHPTAARPALP